MRLHRLRVTAFQAFAGSEEVDFDELGGAGLFLLHGDTGAGKTTLLDAVCFALYGEVPGARARDARLRSDHADPATRTEVELEVTLRERRLRIVRRPRQERPKLRGEGFTEEAAACTVQALDEDVEWTTLAARSDEARAELSDLLGMTCEQFCQVVLLPQGEFATFLRADSTERQVVLERLFGTERFARVEQWLTERRKAAGAELRGALQHVRDVVSRLAQASGEEPPEGWVEDPASLRGWTERSSVMSQAHAATAEQARTAAQAARTEAERGLAAAVDLAERRARHAAAVEQLARWEAARPARDAAQAELSAARRAAPVAALLEAARERESAAAQAATAVDRLPQRWSIDHASPEALRAHAAELRTSAGALDALVDVEQRLARADEELRALERQAHAAADEADEAARALSDADAERVRLEAVLREARSAADRLPGLVADENAARERAAKAVERDRLAGDLDRARDALRTATDDEQAAHAAWLDLRERRLAGMAAELAAGLRPGEPCAVCGALEHPSPASAHDDAPTAEQEREAQQRHAKAAEARAASERARNELATALAAAQAVAHDAPAADLAAHAQRLAQDLTATRDRAALLDATEQALTSLAASSATHEGRRQEANDRAASTSATHAERTSALEADRARVAEARGEAPSVAARARTLRADAHDAETAAQGRAHADLAEAEHAKAAAKARAAARAAGFEDTPAAAAAVRTDAQQTDLEERLRTFDAGLAERRARTQDPTLLAAAAADPPDLDAARTQAAAAAQADDAATKDHALAARRLDEIARLTADLDSALEQLAPVAERERRIRELSLLVDGSSLSNRLRMRLSAYVLAARLEEVAAAATLRLERMSNGRYQLVHSDAGARGRSRGGLELRIVDGWTGRERPPSTLSGGETFLASLALALGLADVVAAEAGGSRLETLFVDEGFGSLDERTLDEVLDVLDGLREGGRAVGIVSHVAELRQRIPARLHVVKGRHGSRVEQRAGVGVV